MLLTYMLCHNNIMLYVGNDIRYFIYYKIIYIVNKYYIMCCSNSGPFIHGYSRFILYYIILFYIIL